MGDGLDIIIFAVIAAFLFFRLRNVLGRRDGHEGGYRDPFRPDNGAATPSKPTDAADDDNIVQLPDRTAESDAEDGAAPSADPLMAGLTRIRVADPAFDAQGFLNGARIAFEMVVAAFASGDRGTLKSMLSGEVFGNFDRVIRDREQAGETVEDTLVGIKSADIVEADMNGRDAVVTVKFVSEQINVTRDAKGDVVDGDPVTVIEVTDFWTFARDTRSSDPNWSLVATRSLD